MSKLLVAGPCSAESREQVLAGAAAVRAAGADIFRAGVWKPRTHPGSFQGMGADAIPWLLEAQEVTGIPAATEVAGAQHVELCLKAGLRVFWIGARTTTNPFLVQEIADALKSKDVKVFVKNPVNPDIDLWMGAVERLRDAGVKDIALVHRGFSQAVPGRYRNNPQWQLLLQVRGRLPGLPLLCDPSHIAGSADLVPEVAQRAMDLGLDGLMVECHPCPETALSDARQQLSRQQLLELMANLVIRETDSVDVDFNARLAELRGHIDAIDDEIVEALAQRMEVSRNIGLLKKGCRVSIVQTSRWDSVLAEVLAKAEARGLDREMVRKIYTLIHESSVQQQQ